MEESELSPTHLLSNRQQALPSGEEEEGGGYSDAPHSCMPPIEGSASNAGEEVHGVVIEEEEEHDDTDHMTCSICMDPWTGEGPHRICSLACGHLFGRSCIKRWLKKQGVNKFGKCPLCNRKAKIGDIHNLYVPQIAIVEGHNTKVSEELSRLQAKNKELSTQNAMLLAQMHEMQAFLSVLCPQQIETIVNAGNTLPKKRVNILSNQCTEQHSKRMEGPHQSIMAPYRNINGCGLAKSKASSSIHSLLASHLHHEAAMPCLIDHHLRTEVAAGCRLPADMVQLEESISHRNSNWRTTCTQQHINMNLGISVQQCHGTGIKSSFQLQDELPLQGAKVFDMDASCQMLLVSQKLSNLKDVHTLTKMSLLALSEWETVHLPSNTGVVRDIRIAPATVRSPGRLALIGSLGKKLSILSLESNNVVLTYNVQSPVWSCAWDPSEPDYFYAGLQNGFVSAFDLRQTALPLNTIRGLHSNPIHSLYVARECFQNGSAISTQLGRREILSASSGGICFWTVGTSNGSDYRPSFLPRLENQGVCVSLAYSATTNIAIATFRPRPGSQECFSGIHSLTQGMNSTPFEASPSHDTGIMSQFCPATHFILKRKASVNESFPNNQTMWFWEHEKVMTGCISNIGMPRSAIIHGSIPGLGNLFASGNEPSKGLWLWDINTLTLSQQLRPHYSPVLDVKSINGSSGTIIGCMSEKQLQIYSH